MDASTTLLFKKSRFDCRNKVVTIDEQMVLALDRDMQKKLNRQGYTTSDKEWTASIEVPGLYLAGFEGRDSLRINIQLHCQQLQHVADSVAQKCPDLIDVMFLYDCTRPPRSLVTYFWK